MPITVFPSTKPLEAVRAHDALQPTSYYSSNPFVMFAQDYGYPRSKPGKVFQASFPKPSLDSSEKDLMMPASNYNGFVNTALEAYNRHHHLKLRPDDIWITILSQFNLCVNGNADVMRHHFVAHSGKKELVIKTGGDRFTVDFGELAQQMTGLIQENVVDPALQKWIIPDFTTTIADDIVVSSILMMATLKQYFDYKFHMMCGLPAVTLLGERSDWEKLLLRAEKLSEYGEATTKWRDLLRPVLAGFVQTFSDPKAQETKDFWQRIAHYSGGGSGPTYLSGWITAFLFFDRDGKSLHEVVHHDVWTGQPVQGLVLDNATFHVVDTSDIPPAYAEVPVLLNDNGVEIKTTMVAGLMGTRVSELNKVVQPQAAWWIAEEVAQETSAST
ncbi:hypothetical protein BGZ70_009373 [Mortierella alpina]|uniref:DUF4419 domain-containing protein n=1 Tax=Mortierella alpina TaxID=64518 RepID=A0A9P6M0T1_MORAP|nr:hypothetical protein BGZ70_009373 [Mortierella alpina]